MTSRSGQPLQRAERTTQVKEVKSKDSVMQENPELLKKPKVSVDDLTEDVHELAADKLRSDENSTLQMFNEEDEDEAEVHEMQIISCEINEQTHKSEEVVHKIRYTLQKSKESLHKEVNTFTETSEPQEFSENAVIHELRLKIQLVEQEHLNLQLCAQIKHDCSGSMNLEIDCEAKQTQSMKILSDTDLYKNSIHSHYCDFCHQMDTGTESMSKKAQYSEMIHHLHYFIMNQWKIYCEEKELVEKWEFLKKFLDNLLEDGVNWIHNVWMKWLWVSKKNEKLNEEYLCCYNKLQFQIKSKANKTDKIQIMFFYCELNEFICRKIHKQSELFIIKKDMVALVKKLQFNLFFCKQKEASPYWKKLKSFQKTNNKSGTKSEGKTFQNDRDQFIKCFNCNKIDHLTKNCWSTKKNKTSVNVMNKKSSQSSHRAYGFSKKDNITEKVKKKSAKINIFKKEAVHKMYGFSQLDLFQKNALWMMAHLMKQKLQTMMNSRSDINFLCLNIVTALKLVLLFSVRDVVDINQQSVNTYSVYHEQISICNDNKEICKHCEPLTSADIESDMILEVIWLAQRDPVISYFQWILTWRENMGSSAESENSDELDL